MKAIAVRIAGIGRYLPQRVVTSDELARLCNVPAGWIEEHAGVSERRWASRELGETNASMGARAALEALAAAGVDAADLDCLIYASATAQQLIPDTSVYVLRELGLADAGITCLSIHSSCLSFVSALDAAACRLASGRNERILVVSSEINSIGLNFREPESAALFGDGAAAVLLTAPADGEDSRIEAVRFETYASAAELTTLKGCGTRKPPNDPGTVAEDNLFAMDGPEVLRFTLRRAPRFLARLLDQVEPEGIACIVPHQSSQAGLAALQRLGMQVGKVVRILDRLGNCVAASIPMALYEAVSTKRLQRGERCLLVGTSAGLTLGGALLRY
jgi:3-oxoacyl-[acyl-carrier-protein] synthase-3